MKIANKGKDGSIFQLVMAVSCVCVSASITFGSSSRIASVCGSLTLLGGALVVGGLLWDRRRRQ